MSTRHIDHLPLRILGLKDIPAVPVEIRQIPGTLLRLGIRAEETKQATQGLSNVYTIGGVTAPAYPFLFGESSPSATTAEGLQPRSLLGKLLSAANPGLTFVGNYPPCLQKTEIPDPTTPIDVKTLLGFLPKTGTIGQMVTFYFTFSFSAPYEPFVPLDGVGTNLFFGDDPDDPRNVALVRLREKVIAVMSELEGGSPQVNQWPLNIET